MFSTIPDQHTEDKSIARIPSEQGAKRPKSMSSNRAGSICRCSRLFGIASCAGMTISGILEE
jgi:hypothetical protein